MRPAPSGASAFSPFTRIPPAGSPCQSAAGMVTVIRTPDSSFRTCNPCGRPPVPLDGEAPATLDGATDGGATEDGTVGCADAAGVADGAPTTASDVGRSSWAPPTTTTTIAAAAMPSGTSLFMKGSLHG